MKELTIVLDNWGHKELKDYLLSLKGILDVNINNEKDLEINIKYDSKLISNKIIKEEIKLFLDIQKTPSIISFDKHCKNKTTCYKIIRKTICCEYCFKGIIEDLFEIDGIEKVESNFTNDYSNQKEIIISIYYDKDILNDEEMKQIEGKQNI